MQCSAESCVRRLLRTDLCQGESRLEEVRRAMGAPDATLSQVLTLSPLVSAEGTSPPILESCGDPDQGCLVISSLEKQKLLQSSSPREAGFRMGNPAYACGTTGLLDTIRGATRAFTRGPDGQVQRDPVSVLDLSTCNSRDDHHRHSSHRSGRDVDILYPEGIPGDESWEEPARLSRAGGRTSARRTAATFKLMQAFVRNGNISEIYVTRSLFDRYCRYAYRSGGGTLSEEASRVLDLLRVDEEHTGHFHVRVHCAPGAEGCRHRPVRPTRRCQGPAGTASPL